MKRTGFVTVAAATILLAGCGGGAEQTEHAVEPAQACHEAFAQALEADEMQDSRQALWPAFEECATLDDFAAAASAHPEVLGEVVPETYARTQCEFEPALEASALCTNLD
ncbi:hypothetical protein DNL40_02055 [Xylanimonas oleitrophica]|uniref:Uncharacterized protein n=1 Tax=Xylanimonas oleitrophica TaxID=2607479 RepID=A0A2W5XWY9_9MICO|nr:hypothetical protein [Xylanimonas oleitrophica]PZR55178.1 hypothetical protein DNL40_02055 [Xylanimonas oleitrophica]